jgi:hypothetical protein
VVIVSVLNITDRQLSTIASQNRPKHTQQIIPETAP